MGLADDPFEWRVRQNGELTIWRAGQMVTTLRGRSAEALLAKLERADLTEVQQLLARATGNYKRGNERRPQGSSVGAAPRAPR